MLVDFWRRIPSFRRKRELRGLRPDARPWTPAYAGVTNAG
jgi:hypothetical protein